MKLVKYCAEKHADEAVQKGRLFVGTSLTYQNIENPRLQDSAEGPAVPAVLDDYDEVVIAEDDNEGLLKYSRFKMANGWKLILPKGMPLWLEQPEFNTFVFCISLEPLPTIERAQRLGYDSFYEIVHPYNFGRALMWSLLNEIESPFGMIGYYGPVNYVPRKVQIVNRKNQRLASRQFSTADFFTKHERFREDNEFRYVFLEYSNREKTEFNSIKSQGVILQNEELCKWITKPNPT